MIRRLGMRIISLGTAIVFSASLVSLISPGVAMAGFNKNLLITDSVFNKDTSMTASQIDAFLNSFPSSCISTKNKFTAIEPTGYNPTDGFKYGSAVSAGKIIYNAAQAYDLNPQVLLATLQKEQSLVSGTAGCSKLRYVGAMGYGCPDGGKTYNYSSGNFYYINGVKVTSVNGTCVNTKDKAGFTQQVIRGAWLLKFGQQRSLGNVNWAIVRGSWNNSDDPDMCYGGPMTKGTFKRCKNGSSVIYDGYTTIDGGSVFMGSGATAALYWYTPHLHGNQSFVSIYEGWFGSTQGLADVAHPDGALVKMPNSAAIFQIKGSQLRLFSEPQVLYSYGYSSANAKQATDPDLALSTGAIMPFREGTLLKGSAATIYIVDDQSGTLVKRPISSWNVFVGLGYNKGSKVRVVNDSSLPPTTGSPVSSATAAHPDGTLIKIGDTVYLIEGGTKRPIPSPQVLFSHNYTWSHVKSATNGDKALSTGAAVKFNEGTLLKSSTAAVYVVDWKNDGSVHKRVIADGNTFYGLGYSYSQVYTVPDSALPTVTGNPIGP